jgi:hypothetical protein
LPGGISLRPARVRWVLDDLLSKDGHRLSVAFSAIARAIDEPAEVQMFTETFAATPSAGSKNAVGHFQPGLTSAAGELAAGDTAENLIALVARSRWIDALKVAANETGFSCGIQVLPPFEVEVTSPTLQKERLEQMQRTADLRRSADRAQQFSRAVELLRQWESLKADVPGITPGKLLEQISPADRGQMLDTLLMAGANAQGEQKPAGLWGVSGSTLIRIEDAAKPQPIPVPLTLGPLRSVNAQDGKLLIGARNGVFQIDPANPQKAVAYVHPGLTSDYGFTAVTQIDGNLWACHREGGLVGWDLNRTDEPAIVFSIAGLGGEPRNLSRSGVFSVGAKVFRLTPQGPSLAAACGPAAVVAILETDGRLLVANEAGLVQVLDQSSLQVIAETNTGGRACSAALLPWLGSHRLLVVRPDGPIECIGLEDQLVTRFTGCPGGVRAVSATASKVAAMSADRQRIVIWNSWDGRSPAAEIHIPSITQHRLADIAFAV